MTEHTIKDAPPLLNFTEEPVEFLNGPTGARGSVTYMDDPLTGGIYGGELRLYYINTEGKVSAVGPMPRQPDLPESTEGYLYSLLQMFEIGYSAAKDLLSSRRTGA